MDSKAIVGWQDQEQPQPLGASRWDWSQVHRVLVVRLRSIGDTVLATPSLLALKRFLPQAEVDILLEDWVAPLLSGHPAINRLVTLQRKSFSSRARVARVIRGANYDVVYNLHGGTTATFLTRATGAPYRIGYATYQYSNLHNHQAPSPLLLWGQQATHSVEQQLALLGWTGVPVTDRPRTQLVPTQEAQLAVNAYLTGVGLRQSQIALLHPTAAFATKQWATEKFARVAEFLSELGFAVVAIAGPGEDQVIEELIEKSRAPIATFSLSLPEVTALAGRARLFVGNDSGIAHIAAAVNTPSVVIFGSSNIDHWRPWTNGHAEIVREEMPCQPCHGYFCEKFDQPECILRVPVSRVITAIDSVLKHEFKKQELEPTF